MNNKGYTESGITPYYIFIFCLNILALVNLALYFLLPEKNLVYVVLIIDLILSFFFFSDFILRLVRSASKLDYLIKGFGWLDFLSCLPTPIFKSLRIIRLVKSYFLIKKSSSSKVIDEIRRNLAGGALLLVLFMIILLLEFGSLAVLYVESGGAGANIKTASDAIWWVYVTITTVGYGDRYPITNTGRIIGVIVMFMGVGLFGVVTGFLANKFIPNDPKTESNSVKRDGELEQLKSEVKEIKTMITHMTNKLDK